MELERYQDLARRTQNQTLTLVQKRMHALHGLASEVGEIHGIYQKTFQGHALRSEDVIDELGDLLWFVAELADVLGMSLNEVAQRNVDKLMKRYPQGFEEVRSVHREPKKTGLDVICYRPEDECKHFDREDGWCNRFDRPCAEVHAPGEAEDE